MLSRLATLELSDSSEDDDSVIAVPTRARQPHVPPAGTAGTLVLPSLLFGTPHSHLSESTTGGYNCFSAIEH
jgi:hypothetical protein